MVGDLSLMDNSWFYKVLSERVNHFGGLFNSHAHLDRAATLKPEYLSRLNVAPIDIAHKYSLRVKQDLVGDLHRDIGYTREDLLARMEQQLKLMIEVGTRRVDSFIDVSADEVGLTALEAALELKEKYSKENNPQQYIDFRVGAYPIFGFRDSVPERWDIFVEGAKRADFLGALPERDAREGHIGVIESFRRTLKLAIELGKQIHYHVDQANDPRENLTEMLVEAVKWLGSPKTDEEGPSVWAVHVISPSAYPEERFRRLLEGLKEYNIGVICCPSAALSMEQRREIEAPTHNSIAKVAEMLAYDIPVRIGTDNIEDAFIPTTTGSLYLEISKLADAIRLYNPDILAKIACGKELTSVDKELINDALEKTRRE